jgi:aspartate/methionine/tyrosine aminotransferase
VFSDYALADDPTRVASLTIAERSLTFSMSGLSKIAGLPQMKLGWIVASGPGHAAALERLELIADTYLSVATPVQIALPRLLSASAAVREQIVERTRANLQFLRMATKDSPTRTLNVEAGWYATLQIPRTQTEEEWVLQLLDRDNVLAQPGFFFDFESEAYLVLSLLTEPSKFQEGVRRICSRMV